MPVTAASCFSCDARSWPRKFLYSQHVWDSTTACGQGWSSSWSSSIDTRTRTHRGPSLCLFRYLPDVTPKYYKRRVMNTRDHGTVIPCRPDFRSRRRRTLLLPHTKIGYLHCQPQPRRKHACAGLVGEQGACSCCCRGACVAHPRGRSVLLAAVLEDSAVPTPRPKDVQHCSRSIKVICSHLPGRSLLCEGLLFASWLACHVSLMFFVLSAVNTLRHTHRVSRHAHIRCYNCCRLL